METSQILLGLGNNVDYEVEWDQAAFQDHVTRLGLTSADLTQAMIVDERSLVGSMCELMATGRGGEYPVASLAIMKEFLSGFRWRNTMGGTAPRAAIAMSRLGVPGTLHLTTMNAIVRELLPSGFDWICSSEEGLVFPHLILQYPAGVRIELVDGAVVESRQANRGIYVRDDANATMALSSRLLELAARARIILLSGLNAMSDSGALTDRLVEIGQIVQEAPPGALIMLEEAGYHDERLGALVRATLAPATTVYSMNVEEFGHLTGMDSAPDEPREMIQAIREARTGLGTRNLMVHSAEWSLVCGPDARRLRPAVELGMAVGAARYIRGDDWQVSDLEAIRCSPEAPSGRCLAEWSHRSGEDIVGVPGRVASTRNPTTIGLGDTFVGAFLAGVARG